MMKKESHEREEELQEKEISSGETYQPAGEAADEKIADIEEELMETQDRLLRAAADFENYKKRRQREVEE